MGALATAATARTELGCLPFCVIDLEGTGGSPAAARITEVGAVRVRQGRVVGRFTALVDPGCPIPPAVAELTGIDDRMVAGRPPAVEVLSELMAFVGDDVIVAHDAVWDLRLLNVELVASGRPPIANRWLDTLAAARHVLDRREVDRFDLATLARWAGASQVPVHRALADAEATAAVLERLIDRAAERGIDRLDRLHRATGIVAPERVAKLVLAESLPKRRGTFVLRDRSGRALHVGAAPSVRRSVMRLLSPSAVLPGHLVRSVSDVAQVDYTPHHSAFVAAMAQVEQERRLRPRHRVPAPRERYLVVRRHGPVEQLAWDELPPDPLAIVGPIESGDLLRSAHRAVVQAYPQGGVLAAAALGGNWSAPAIGGLAACGPDAAAALLRVVATGRAIRRARDRVALLVEPGPAPGWVEVVAVSGGQPVAVRAMPTAGWRLGLLGVLEHLRQAAPAPWPMSPAAWRRARVVERRLAQRGGHPAAIHLTVGWNVSDVCVQMARALAVVGVRP